MDQLLDVYTCPIGGLFDLDADGHQKKIKRNNLN
jgi:hypothetical protein